MATDTTTSAGHTPLRAVVAAAAFTASMARPSLIRRWSRKAVQSTPPPLPLISLPPDDEWEEFDVPVKTGFGYFLPDVGLHDEEAKDESNTNGVHATAPLRHDRAAICRVLSEYMTQNEAFQVKRHGFGIDSKLVFKRTKSNIRGRSSSQPAPVESPGDEELAFNAFFESGNLDRAYRVLGRHYATTQELLGNPTSSHANGSTTATSTASTPWSSPFPFFAKADMEYDLFCDTDVSTHGHIQWYFFRVFVPIACFKRAAQPASTTSTTLRVRFNIRNMLKKASLYNDGMLPAVYIDGKHGRGWHHAGTNVCYFKNADTYRNRKSGRVSNYYTLSFVYEFQLPSDATDSLCVYFAHCYPYTYTRLQRYLTQLQKDPERNRFFRRRVLCKTIAGNICDVLTITDFSQEDDARSGVILTARVHPGESNASFIMHGIIDFLTGASLEARYLRHRFVFKIVPMLNPDGVIHGNYRCSLAGTDLNRRYMDPSPELHPTVYATKNMVLSMRKTRAVSLYCDIHGHSRKKNMFLYGCLPYEENSRTEAAKLRLFPHVLCKTCNANNNTGATTGGGGYFSFPDCTFSVSKSKKGTGRVVVWDEAQVLNSFTLEASFFGVGVNKSSKRAIAVMPTPSVPSNQQQRRPGEGNNQTSASVDDVGMTHFMPNDLRCAGAKFCLSLIPFAHLTDRDRPAPPQAVVATANTEGSPDLSAPVCFSGPSSANSGSLGATPASWRPQTTMGMPIRQPPNPANSSPREDQASSPIYDSKLRLAPLPSSPLPSSTPFLLPRSPAKMPVLPTSPSSFVAVGSAPSFDSLFSMEGLFASMSSPEDLLKEIEDTLPENYSQCGDSDDEGESAGSESDPSGDNMEEEELQRQDSWKTLVPDTGEAAPASPPKLTKNRSQALLKRFSDSMLRIAQLAEENQPTTPPLEPAPVLAPEPESAAAAPVLSREVSKSKPAAALAPVRAPIAAPVHTVSRPSSYLLHANQTTRDRNRDIASLHLRAVQRRSRTKRAGRQIVVNEQDLQ